MVTKKGQGYKHAEDDPCRFHGIAPFDRRTGEPVAGGRPAPPSHPLFGQTLFWPRPGGTPGLAIQQPCPRVRGSKRFAETFPDRFVLRCG